MNKGVYTTTSETPIEDLHVLNCRTSPEVASISNRTLGGLWFTQTIGSPGIRADVELIASGMTARDRVLDFFATGAAMVIVCDGFARTGYILEKPAIDLIGRGNPENRVFKIRLILGVNNEEEAT
jgi:hypothetical protein